MQTCSIPSCGEHHCSRGWCQTHYNRWRYWGDPLATRPTHKQRFWMNVDRNGPVPAARPELGPCWIWTGRPDSKGYGRIGVDRMRIAAHRYSYELLVGPIPKGMELDHLCRVTMCVNPAHLDPVTHEENMRRSPAAAPAFRAARTHCPQGHPYAGDNLYINSKGNRECRVCRREHRRLRSERERLEAA